ncbi:hypothetical protein [uncultured Sphingomonas sp.]|uniref:hypothetical protein n=1 Tax=uncultured Sphingomonas sp. TaxID=158754 RepID=UPI00261ABDBC|nr:hypothetical protein [uncultured Sphingomonas sp.]
MSILLVTYDLKAPGRNYQPVWDYFKQYNRCKDLESVYLIETDKLPATVRDELGKLIDANDKIFIVKLARSWAARRFGCGDWLNEPARKWG